MSKYIQRILSVLLTFALVSISTPLSFAADEVEYISRDTFWNWAAGRNGVVKQIINFAGGLGTCSKSDDTYHHASSYLHEGSAEGEARYRCICDYCGNSFTAYASDLQKSYDAQVSKLPAPGVNSEGYLYFYPTFYYGSLLVPSDRNGSNSTSFYFGDIESESTQSSWSISNHSSPPSSFSFSGIASNTGVYQPSFLRTCFLVSCPVDGYYSYSNSFYGNISFLDALGKSSTVNIPLSSSVIDYGYRASGYSFQITLEHSLKPSSQRYYQIYSYFNFSLSSPPFVRVKPLSGLIDPIGDITYNINSRPTSIIGDYGIIGDNGQIIKVEGNTIINETNSTVYNPVTNTTSNVTDWHYDYSTRTYILTLDNGTTSTVTYGDENVTIIEGDTIYNIYYLVDGSGENPGPGPGVCNHSWTETSTTPAACTVPGSRLLTCSLCSQTKTETIPAPGHTWTIRLTVNTQYDDTGQLVQEGYTIYECSVCGEQYKSTDGGAPPGGGSGSGPGSSGGVFSGIFGLLVDFLGFFWNTFHNFVGEGVKGFLTALMDGTSSIFGLLNPFNWGG